VSDSTDKAALIALYSQHPVDSKYMRLIAHDVRNHMNTILIANDILHAEIQAEDGDPLKYLAMIRRAGADILVVLDAAVAAAVKQDKTETSE
jgi:hypothetical protein